MYFVRGHAKRVLKCVQCKYLQQFPNSFLKVTSSLKPFSRMEGLEGIRGAEGGMESEFHDIPSQGPSQTSQTSYIRAPAQGLPSTNEFGGATETSCQVNYTNQPLVPALTILFKMLREDGRPLPVGCFSERGVARKVYALTGVTVERVTMVTPTDALVEFAPGTLVVTIAQALDQITEWEDHRVWVSVLMGNRQYIMKLCQERAETEEQKKAMEAEVERMHENQLEQQDKLSELIDKVNDQAKMVGEMQRNQVTLQSGFVPRIPQLQGQVPVHSSVASSGSVPRIPSSVHTPTGVYGTTNVNPSFQGVQKKNTKNPDLPIFSGETPTPKGEVEYDNYIFQLQMLRSSYTDDAIHNAIVATVRTQAKMAIRAIGYGSNLDTMIRQLQDRFGLGETVDLLGQEFHQLMQQPKEKVGEFGGKLEYKFRLLQEKCPGRYVEDQLRDRLFHGMSDKLRDSVRFLYSQPDCDFTKLLRAAMTCENEAASRASIKAESLQVSTDESEQVASNGISSIREQLDQMRTILKGANFKPNNGFKSQKDGKQDLRNKLKGPGTSSAGPFRKGKRPVQCHRCNGWGHYKQQCPSEEPVEGSKEWANLNGEETKKGGPLPQDQPTNPQQ